MASGNTHDKTTIALALGATIAAHFFSPTLEPQWWWEPNLAPTLGTGVMAGLWISPDLDLDRCNALRRWGLLRIIWTPYRWLIPCHRHWFSHLPVIGTIGRVAYLSLPLTLLVGSSVTSLAHNPYVLAIVAGLAIADLGHWLLDGMPVRF